MPFLRVIRDKRGYETTYLMHWFNENGRQRSRILYVFRGPSVARVGRMPLEPETMRHLESLFPEVPFDWKAVIAERQVIEPAPETRRRRPRREESQPPAPLPEAAPPAAQAPAPERPRAIPAVLPAGTDDERVAFLREWYPVVRERVERRTTDEVRRQALLTVAERLNSATWGEDGPTPDHLSAAAEALERLTRVLSRRRRRGKPPGAAPAPS